MAPFDIDIAERDGSLVLTVRGEIDITTAPLLEEELGRAAATDAVGILVDLDQVSFMDSTGLHVLIKYAASSGQTGQRFHLTRGSAQVRRLFEISGAKDYLPFLAD